MKSVYKGIAAILLAAAAGFLSADSAVASDIQYECTTNGAANWRVNVTTPELITCPTGGGICTRMRYTITALKSTGVNQDHVAVLAAHDVDVVTGTSVTLFPVCDGDTVTEIGIRDCSNRAVRLNTKSDVGTYDLVVRGDDAVAIDSSIVIKKGSTRIEECRIASLGFPPPPPCDPKEQKTTKESFMFNDCEIEVDIDPCTGDSGDARVVSGDCVIDVQPVESLQIVINGVAQNVTTGDGWISSGDHSCTTKVNRLTKQAYTICDCTSASDPSPPCD